MIIPHIARVYYSLESILLHQLYYQFHVIDEEMEGTSGRDKSVQIPKSVVHFIADILGTTGEGIKQTDKFIQ